MRYNKCMDPNLPNQSIQSSAHIPITQSQATPMQMPPSAGHPEHERKVSETLKPTEVIKPVEQKPAMPKPESKAVNEIQSGLELSKEILPGLHEVHHHSEPITLPTQIQNAGLTSVPLPMGANTYNPDKMVLPLSHKQVEEGLHHSVTEQVRWLSEWCVKQIKEAHLMASRLKSGKGV